MDALKADVGGGSPSVSLVVIPPEEQAAASATDSPNDLVPIQVVKTNDDSAVNNTTEENLQQGDVGGDPLAGSGEDIQDWSDIDSEMKRVKVYELVGSSWVDQGTAFCFGHFTEGNVALLTARSEKNFNEVILTTTIRSNDVYQRQQDTLIVWTEPDGVDYALSFQDPDGCAEVWNFITEVQRHMNDEQGTLNLGSSSPVLGPEPVRLGHLPTPQLGIISDIERSIKINARSQAAKERLCEYIQHEDYIKQMIDVMNVAEDIEALDSLHALCSLMQTILMLNDHSMYEHILDDDLFYGVCGMLEYDPEFPQHKANYREFLANQAHFHEPIPLRDHSITRKIHHTYRLQFLKDVVLARALDDSTFNVLNSCIIFNQIDIITHVQQDLPFLHEIVRLYVDEDMLSGGGLRKPQPTPQPSSPTTLPTESSPATNGASSATLTPNPPPTLEEQSAEELKRKREVIFLIQQLCTMGKNVQLPARMTLFRSLVDRGILFAVQWALSQPEKDEESHPVISAGGEILAALLDHDLNGVRGHVLKQVVAIEKEKDAGKKGADRAETIVQMACKIMANSKDLSVQNLLGDSLKSWLDIPPGGNADPGHAGPSEAHGMLGAMSKFPPRKDDPGTERFMDYFYKDCINILFKPFYEIPEWRAFTDPVLPLTREQTNRFVYLCDLLYSFALQHHFRSHFFIMSSNISVRVATLFKARDKHLRHASFRFFRLLLKQNNPNMHSQVMKHDILKPILDLTIRESRRDNLLSCSCQEYFEHMRRENIKDMIKFCMTKHEEEIKTLAQSPLGGQRFQLFIRKWEMNNEPPPSSIGGPSRSVDVRIWPTQRGSLDAEEEDYFNGDDEDDISIPPISQQFSRGNGISSPMPSGNSLKRKRRIAVGNVTKGYRSQNHNPLRSPLLEQLSDYGGDEDEEELAKDSRPAAALETSASFSTSLGTGPLSKRPREDDDDEDNRLESIARGHSRPQSPAPGVMASLEEPMRPGGKRRRSDEDDDDLSGLVKTKKPDLGTQKAPSTVSGRPAAKSGDDPPTKKLRLKLAPTSVAAVSSIAPAPSDPEGGAKDRDTG